ncbi:glycoside hydrolase family 75 protein [Burkholderia vietnamiensis]|uniref:glycoside hydrolase family 75 protein n=1 Tax=Burkholderia vietnamiensis TaxID=60552 RepID=UPI001B9A190C|nr:glycoside hydrolase family 75 protein [Burkholderia vietnamiensis]MBR8279065.1 hypothetical protein [Burkholderia vietnamiensis]
MPRTIGTISAQGFISRIVEDDDLRVYYTADADIDADGANGQNDAQAAYMVGDQGSELLANGGMRMEGTKVVCAHEWARSIVLLDADNEPKVFPGGVIASTTWYRNRALPASDPASYVDAQTIPYVVVPPLVVTSVIGVVRGCKARVTWQGISVDCVVADLGPTNRIGEISIAAADALGMNSSPRNGGIDTPEVLYELWPGVAAPGFELQPA